VWHSWRIENKIVEKFSAALGFLSLPTPPRDPSVDFRAFSLNMVKMDLTLSWMGVLEEPPLVWLGIAVEICWIYVSNILLKLRWFCIATVKFSILALMFSRSFSMSWIFLPSSSFILTWSLMMSLRESSFLLKFYPLPPCWQVVKCETRLHPPSIEALIRTKTNVRITNEVDILGGCQIVDAHVACFSALFTRYSGVNHFEMIEARVLKLLHKINLGGEHVHLFKLVNLAGVGLSVLLILALIRGHLLNQFTSFLSSESKERTSRSSIYMLSGWANQLMIDALNDEPLLHAMMGACSDIILQACNTHFLQE
jgi:hypothetical protein